MGRKRETEMLMKNNDVDVLPNVEDDLPIGDVPLIHKKIGRRTRRMMKLFLRLEVNPNIPLMKQKVLKLRLFDRMTAWLFAFAYVVFVTVMFVIGTAKSGQD